jgi:hypothetical protein
VTAQASHDEHATAAEAEQLVVVGLIVAPGLTEDLAHQLVRKLPQVLHDRLPQYYWMLVVREDIRVGSAGIDTDLVRLARERMLAEGWDLTICLTDLPLHVGRRPVTAYASVALGVGVVSVPAFGPLGLEDQVRDSVAELLERMLSGSVRGREVRFVDGAVVGNLRLLVGMIRANRPWELIVRLSRALTAALGGAAFSLVSPGVWQVAAGVGPLRLVVLTVGSILATSATLIVVHDLWERSLGPAARDRVVLLNLSVVLTVVLGILTLYVALLVINAVCVGLLIPSSVLSAELGEPVGLSDYLQLAWLVSSLATIGGALGVVVENDLAVREAVYGYRADDDHRSRGRGSRVRAGGAERAEPPRAAEIGDQRRHGQAGDGHREPDEGVDRARPDRGDDRAGADDAEPER